MHYIYIYLTPYFHLWNILRMKPQTPARFIKHNVTAKSPKNRRTFHYYIAPPPSSGQLSRETSTIPIFPTYDPPPFEVKSLCKLPFRRIVNPHGQIPYEKKMTITRIIIVSILIAYICIYNYSIINIDFCKIICIYEFHLFLYIFINQLAWIIYLSLDFLLNRCYLQISTNSYIYNISGGRHQPLILTL